MSEAQVQLSRATVLAIVAALRDGLQALEIEDSHLRMVRDRQLLVGNVTAEAVRNLGVISHRIASVRAVLYELNTALEEVRKARGEYVTVGVSAAIEPTTPTVPTTVGGDPIVDGSEKPPTAEARVTQLLNETRNTGFA